MVSNQGTYFVTPMDNSMEQTGFPTGKPKQAHHQYHDSTSFDPFHPTEFSADEIYQPVPIYSSSELWDLQEKELLYKHVIRVLRFLARFVTFFLAFSNTATQSVVLHKFLTTRNIIINDRNAWAAHTTIWTTILLLVVSVVTAIVSSMILGSYLSSGGVKRSNRVNATAGMGMAVVGSIAHMLVSLVAAATYRGGKTGHDLWGWTCDAKAQEIQPEFKEVIDFNHYCGIQSASWYVSLAMAVLAVLLMVAYIMEWKRGQIKKITNLNVKLEPVRV
ncbi:hypothetical protein MMC14_001386 [Varicellaria rhodocarpa]|nr:hypothetical protein [Varicellaria rhodocarpa]